MQEPSPTSANDLTTGRFCPACGYNLHGISSDRCPECGHGVDAASLAISVIPWTHRRSLGRVRAYLRTVLMSIVFSKRMAQEIGRPASFRDAILFRRVTAALAAISIAGLAVCLLWLGGALDGLSTYRYELLAALFFWICVWLFFLASGGVASYWFHSGSRPIELQNRAVAISYYACGPLALTPIAVLMICTAAVFGYMADQHSYQPSATITNMIACLATAGVGLFISEFALMLISAGRLLHYATRCSTARSMSCWIGLPVAWLILGIILLVALPAAMVFLLLMFISFH